MATINLDEEQRAAASAPERFVRVLAGAGTGKTTTLVARVRYLVQQEQFDPRQLCVLTFSKRASEELARRCGPSATGAFIGTIHSLGYRVLQFEHLNRPVADPRKCRTYVLQAMRELGIKESLSLVYSRITRSRAFGQPYHPTLEECGRRYEELLHGEPTPQWDFDDLLLRPVQLLGEQEAARGRWASRYKHVLVDEAQDTSYVQWALIRYLVGLTTSVYIVGDVYQAIYTWRGADANGMLDGADARFLGPGEEFKTYTVGVNYRSYPTILRAANRTLEGKVGAVPLVPVRQDDGTDPIVSVVYEESVTGSATQALRSLGQPDWHSVVILGRTRAALGQAEASCVRLGIPYVVLGGSSFYERTEVRDVLAYLEYALDIQPVSDALERIYNRPSRYLGKVWFDALVAQGGWSQWEAITHGGGPDFRWPQRYMKDRADELRGICRHLRTFTPDIPAVDVIDYVLTNVGYKAWVRREGVAEAEATEDNDVEDNLDALRELAEGYTLARFMGFVDVCRRMPKRVTQTDGAVVLSTIHRAKGLEWPIVIVVGLEEGILPHHRGDPEGEERRLYYVAVTRPMNRLVLALSGIPAIDAVDENTPSRYVRETCETLGFSWEPPQELLDGDTATETLALPAPQHEGDRPLLGNGGDDSPGPDGPAAGGLGYPGGDPGISSPPDGITEAGSPDNRDLPGNPGVVVATGRKRRRKREAAKGG
jgi:DNA helicase II / ATP-dependent DNA helicase PcrA